MTDTRVDAIADGIFRLNTPVTIPGGAFSFNQYLIVDDEPLLFHTGPKRLFSVVREALARVIAPNKLRFVAFSHFESDECGSLNEWLAFAPNAEPVCGVVNTMINADTFDRPPRTLADGEELVIGRHRLRWFDTPHLPHAWECGYLGEETTRTLMCGDLFTQPGPGDTALTTSDDILGSSEAFRKQMDYFSHARNARAMIERLAATSPATLACMHGSAYQGDCAKLLRALGTALDA
jgi:flavorubredoxin